MSNMLWEKWKVKSGLPIHLLSKVLLEELEAEQVQQGCPHWAPRLHSPVLVVCVHLGHRQLIPAPLAQQDSLSMRFCKISFTSLVSTNTRDRTANAAATSRSSADLRTSEEQLSTIEGDDKYGFFKHARFYFINWTRVHHMEGYCYIYG